MKDPSFFSPKLYSAVLVVYMYLWDPVSHYIACQKYVKCCGSLYCSANENRKQKEERFRSFWLAGQPSITANYCHWLGLRLLVVLAHRDTATALRDPGFGQMRRDTTAGILFFFFFFLVDFRFCFKRERCPAKNRRVLFFCWHIISGGLSQFVWRLKFRRRFWKVKLSSQTTEKPSIKLHSKDKQISPIVIKI